MIKSEEQRAELSKIITHWSYFTKAKILLRPGDIPNLVNQILDCFYHIKLCCGHLVSNMDDSVTISFNDNTGVVTGAYCQECAERYKIEFGAWEGQMYDQK